MWATEQTGASFVSLAIFSVVCKKAHSMATQYGTLGFVANDSHLNVRRDAGYIGTSGHPSRKEYSGAARPQDEMRRRLKDQDKGGAAPVDPTAVAVPDLMAIPVPPSNVRPSAPNESVLLQRRCEFLEAQDKRHVADIAELRGEAAAQTSSIQAVSAQSMIVSGETMRETPACEVGAGEAFGSRLAPVPPGQRVKLIYPMKREGASVWMRRVLICPRTAQVSHQWVKLFEDGEAQGADDTVYVTHFT